MINDNGFRYFSTICLNKNKIKINMYLDKLQYWSSIYTKRILEKKTDEIKDVYISVRGNLKYSFHK